MEDTQNIVSRRGMPPFARDAGGNMIDIPGTKEQGSGFQHGF